MRTYGTLIRCAALLATAINLLVVFYLGILPWYSHWGADDTDVRRALSGDETVPPAPERR